MTSILFWCGIGLTALVNMLIVAYSTIKTGYYMKDEVARIALIVLAIAMTMIIVGYSSK